MARILLVEDDEAVRDMLTQMLERNKHQVQGAVDGENALEVLKEFNEKLDGKIQTNISKIKNYNKAEEYHQNYIEKNR